MELEDFDDLAVAHEHLGQRDLAIEAMARKVEDSPILAVEPHECDSGAHRLLESGRSNGTPALLDRRRVAKNVQGTRAIHGASWNSNASLPHEHDPAPTFGLGILRAPIGYLSPNFLGSAVTSAF